MKFINNSNDLQDEFKKLCTRFYHYAWATAWAGDYLNANFVPREFLKNDIPRMEYFVVGLHFYQTSPKFIKHFMNDDRVRFINETQGVFHPKVYFFYNKNEDTIEEWTAIIGSSNFTTGGFNKNIEANILISSEDTLNETGKEILNFIKSLWEEAKLFSENDYNKYLTTYNNTIKKRNSWSAQKPIRNNSHLINSFRHMSWEEYCKHIRHNANSYKSRIDILKEAGNIFKDNTWYEISKTDKAHIGGYGKGIRNSGWANFGWNTYLQIKSKNINHELLANAMDSIPLYPEPIPMTKAMNIAKRICKAVSIDNSSTDKVATFSRYMAMKRPDLFICCNGQNTNLRKNYHVPEKLDFQSYFRLLLPRIYSDDWYQNADCSDELYPYRVAMLDTFLNDWN